jgi:hypothetical protein
MADGIASSILSGLDIKNELKNTDEAICKMSLKALLVVILFIFIGAPLSWAQTCENIFVRKEFPGTSEILLQMKQWNQLFQEYKLEVLPEVVVGNESSHFNYFKNRIGLMNHKISHRSVVLAHEFAHRILYEHLWFTWGAQRLSQKKTYSSFLEKHGDVYEKIQLMKDVMRRLAEEIRIEMKKNGVLSKELERLQQVWDKKEKEYRELMVLRSSHFTMQQFLSSYHELFADIIPALLWRDPLIITRYISFPKKNSEFDQLHPDLDFETHWGKYSSGAVPPLPRSFQLTSFKGWMLPDAKNSPYLFFAPVRGALWEVYLKEMPIDHLPRFVKTFVETVGIHTALRQKRMRESGQEEDLLFLSVYNQDFLRIFVQRAKINGLHRRTLPPEAAQHLRFLD